MDVTIVTNGDDGRNLKIEQEFCEAEFVISSNFLGEFDKIFLCRKRMFSRISLTLQRLECDVSGFDEI